VRHAITIGLNAVIVAVTGETPRVLTVRRAEHELAQPRPWDPEAAAPAIPFGPLDPEGDRTLELGVRGWVRTQAGLELGYVEQLYTFGDRFRDPREHTEGARVVSVAYLALVRERALAGSGKAAWDAVYGFLPWEDWREGQPWVIEHRIAPALAKWAASDSGRRKARRERIDIAFGLRGAAWDSDRVLERYELLYEVGLVPEAVRDGATHWKDDEAPLGEPMALDHRRMLATALGRLRGKIRYRPVVFELLPDAFTLNQLQRVVESLAGLRLHKQNFRRLVEHAGLVEGTGQQESRTGGRPAELFRFRREVLRERRAPGVGLPSFRRSTERP
jgi:hypothetical protein